MKVLSIDPAGGKSRGSSLTGRALLDTEGRALLEYGVLTWDQVADRDTRLKLLNQCDLLVIEDQYHGKDPRATKMIIEAKCRWTVLARDEGIPVYEVMPSEWQSKTCVGWKMTLKREQLALGVRAYVMSRFRLSGEISQDAISAIGIGSYAVDMIALGRLEV